MKIEVEAVSPVERKVTIEVDPERVAKELERAYVGLGRRVKLRGFRPGKAPRKVLERQFRDQVESEVVEQLVTATFSEAVREHAIEAVAPPHVSFAEGGRLAEGEPLRFTARVEVKPKVEPKDYRGLAVTRRPPEVTDALVSEELTKLQESMAQLVAAEGKLEAQEGDYAVIDHEGTVEGQPFEGGRAEGVTVKVGAGAIQEGFIPQLVGRKVGETVEFDEKLPDDHQNEALRGKTAHMKVTLKALKVRQLPALDDAFAKEVGLEGVETLEALRARMRTDLEKRETRRADA
ncbi:MAG TPA: trigger factor, partial [Anaeromyxobacteraceae bacterium]|nr:trigger factor [Anaeromyxobacteraceae bacterium]